MILRRQKHLRYSAMFRQSELKIEIMQRLYRQFNRLIQAGKNEAFLFRLVYTLALRFDMPASMLKLVSSVIVIVAISGPYLKGQLPLLRRRAQMRKEVR